MKEARISKKTTASPTSIAWTAAVERRNQLRHGLKAHAIVAALVAPVIAIVGAVAVVDAAGRAVVLEAATVVATAAAVVGDEDAVKSAASTQ